MVHLKTQLTYVYHNNSLYLKKLNSRGGKSVKICGGQEVLINIGFVVNKPAEGDGIPSSVLSNRWAGFPSSSCMFSSWSLLKRAHSPQVVVVTGPRSKGAVWTEPHQR